MESPTKPTNLITLATGRQGTSTAIQLLSHNCTVQAFVRSTTSPRAQHLQSLGCTLFSGCVDSVPSITAAIKVCTGLFLNLLPNPQDPDAEARQAQAFINCALETKTVTHIVVTTALHTDKHPQWLAENQNYPMASYYGAKFAIEEVVRGSGLNYTILRPAWLMNNYIEPLWRTHFPNYQSHHLLEVAYPPGAMTAHFDAADVGKFAAAAFLDPERFNELELQLVNEQLSIEDVAKQISRATGVAVKARYVEENDEVERLARKAPGLGIRRWGPKEGGYNCKSGDLEKYGIELTGFEEWTTKGGEGVRGGSSVKEIELGIRMSFPTRFLFSHRLRKFWTLSRRAAKT